MKKVRTIVVEDETLFRKLLEGFLKRDRRYEVVGEAWDGRIALDLCLREKPDLLLLDVAIPGLSGDEVAKKLMASLPALRVLVVSASGDPALIRHLQGIGVHGFVHKEQNPEDLIEAISAVARGGEYFPEIAEGPGAVSAIRTVIVEDETLMRVLLAGALRNDRRFDLLGEAEDGDQGLELCRQTHPDLVLLDVLLPKMQGPELASKILQESPDTRILVISGRQEPAIIRNVLKSGVHGYLDKRQSPSVLKEAIVEVACGRTYYTGLAQTVLKEMSHRVDLRLSPSALSPRENEILRLVAKGMTTKEITFELHVSESTVKTHRYNIMRKLDIHDVAGLTRFALDQGLLLPE